MHGTGTMRWANSDKYTGQWEEDKMVGKGVYRSVFGIEYKGSLKNDGNRGTYYKCIEN